MTLDEAYKVAHICTVLDNRTSFYYGDLVSELNRLFPDFHWSRSNSGIEVSERR